MFDIGLLQEKMNAARDRAEEALKLEIEAVARLKHGITEGFHNKMKVLQRQAYGFRNFNNYRLRVRIMCS